MTKQILARLIPSKNVALAALAALSLAASIAPAANAAGMLRHGPYDNTGNGPDTTGLQGGGG